MKNWTVAAACLLSACISAPSEEDIRNADYGPPPRNYQATIGQFLDGYLRDPMSAQVRYVAGPAQNWSNFMGDRVFGWGVCYSINARNAYGGYTGARLYYFIIRYDQVATEFHDSGESVDIGRSIAQSACAEIARDAARK